MPAPPRRSAVPLLTLCCLVGLLVGLLVGPTGNAEDIFVTIGGGPEPVSNQVSLESNVRFFERTLNAAHPGDPTHHLYFADGDIDKRDLQYVDDSAELTDGGRWLMTLFGNVDQASMRYRNSELSDLTGPTRKAVLRQKFYELADSMVPGDRLFLYVTAHGGPAVGESEGYQYGYDYSNASVVDGNPFNTTISLWNNEDLTAAELTTWLNDFHPDVNVVMVMAQCYAGGFARTIFQNADPRQGLTSARRCGFFSQRHSKPSTGCTPLVDESTYRDYSTYFWEAIGGHSRLGEPVQSPDFNADGVVSLNEAHAHCLISADSMDVPILTSDVLLRKYSRIVDPAPPAEEESVETAPGFFASLFGADSNDESKKTQPAATIERLLARDQTIDQCRSLGRPEQAMVIARLAAELSIDTDQTVLQVGRRAAMLQKRLKQQETLWLGQLTVNSTSVSEIRNAVLREYPELQVSGPHPAMLPLMTDGRDAEAFLAFIDDYPITQTYLEGVKKADRLLQKHDRLQNRHAKAIRLRRTLDTVLLQTNLAEVASPDRIAAVRRLIEMESGSIAVP